MNSSKHNSPLFKKIPEVFGISNVNEVLKTKSKSLYCNYCSIPIVSNENELIKHFFTKSHLCRLKAEGLLNSNDNSSFLRTVFIEKDQTTFMICLICAEIVPYWFEFKIFMILY